MPSKPRRCVSLRGETYEQLNNYARARGQSCSGVVEKYVATLVVERAPATEPKTLLKAVQSFVQAIEKMGTAIAGARPPSPPAAQSPKPAARRSSGARKPEPKDRPKTLREAAEAVGGASGIPTSNEAKKPEVASKPIADSAVKPVEQPAAPKPRKRTEFAGRTIPPRAAKPAAIAEGRDVARVPMPGPRPAAEVVAKRDGGPVIF
jgi:hypothetical protein